VPSVPGAEDELLRNSAVDDFFGRLKQDLRHPKPGQESVAAALEAVKRLALEVDTEGLSAIAENAEGQVCPSCGHSNPREHRFCATCGVPLQASPEPAMAPSGATAMPTQAPGEHHYHHHYHHHYFSSPEDQAPVPIEQRTVSANVPAAPRDASRLRSAGGALTLSRAETAVRKLTQDWALACNTRHLDDLVELYVADAILLRANVPAVRGTAAIREFFFSSLDAGLGEAELETLRVEVFGEIAYEAGRYKILAPVAMGKRREERGKYLVLLARQAGDWKILVDCWSSDLSLGVAPEAGAAKPNVQAPAAPPGVKPPRKA